LTNTDPSWTSPLLLDSRQVSRLLGIGRTKVFQMMARDELPTVRVERCVRVPREALNGWVRDRTRIAGDRGEFEARDFSR